jgi:hypothetical protein
MEVEGFAMIRFSHSVYACVCVKSYFCANCENCEIVVLKHTPTSEPGKGTAVQ